MPYIVDDDNLFVKKKEICSVFSTNVRMFREKFHLSQQQLAYGIGCRQATISDIENNGSYTPSMWTLVKMSIFFEVPVIDLLTEQTPS